ncbi:MAG: copper transporter [Aeromicrobium sp.]
MINFRFHLVSIAAILIALAAGIALGSGPLDDAGDALSGKDVAGQTSDPAVRAFETGYAGRTGGALLKGQLKGQPVVLLTVPGASSAEVRGVAGDLVDAGATVTGEIALTSKILSSSSRQFAEGVAQQSAADVPGVGSAGDSYGRVGAALARSVMKDTGGKVDSTATTIRSAFTEGDLIAETKAPKRLATLAVLVTGPQRSGGSEQSTVIAALAGAFNGTGRGIVVVGPSSSSTDGGAVKAVRDGDAGSEISTVDVTDSAAGRIVVALAAAQQVGGKPGAWGTSRSADGAVPD